jgi:hypothetical protein
LLNKKSEIISCCNKNEKSKMKYRLKKKVKVKNYESKEKLNIMHRVCFDSLKILKLTNLDEVTKTIGVSFYYYNFNKINSLLLLLFT